MMIDWRWAEVDSLEKQERWNDAKSLLINTWKQNPHDLKVTIRLGFFCWYILAEEQPLGIKDVDLEVWLKEVTQFGLTNFVANEDFLWSIGYMISLFPYFFGDYEIWEAKGISLLKSAYEQCPTDPVYKYSYLACFNEYGKLEEELHQVQVVLEERFQGDGLLSEYFKDVWRIKGA